MANVILGDVCWCPWALAQVGRAGCETCQTTCCNLVCCLVCARAPDIDSQAYILDESSPHVDSASPGMLTHERNEASKFHGQHSIYNRGHQPHPRVQSSVDALDEGVTLPGRLARGPRAANQRLGSIRHRVRRRRHDLLSPLSPRWWLRAIGGAGLVYILFSVLVAADSGALGPGARSVVLDARHWVAGTFRPLWDRQGHRGEEAGWARIRYAGPAAGCLAHGWRPLPTASTSTPETGLGNSSAPLESRSQIVERSRRVVDSFLFNGEFHLLRVRLTEMASGSADDNALATLPHETGPAVTMVVVESTRTFTGLPKRRLLAEAVRAALEIGEGPLAGWITRDTVRLVSASGGHVNLPRTGSHGVGETPRAWKGWPARGVVRAAMSRSVLRHPSQATDTGALRRGSVLAANTSQTDSSPGTQSSDAAWGGVPLVDDAKWAPNGWETPPAPPAPAGRAAAAVASRGGEGWSSRVLGLGLPLLVVVDAGAEGGSARGFGAEGRQRGAARAQAAAAAPVGALMLSGDVDEIPRRGALELLRGCAVEGSGRRTGGGTDGSGDRLVAPARWVGHDADDAASKAAQARPNADVLAERNRADPGVHLGLRTYLYSLEHPRGEVRHGAAAIMGAPGADEWWSHTRRYVPLLEGAGWHLSWAFRTVEQAIDKAVTYSHADRAHKAEHTQPAAMQRRMCLGEDPFDQVPEAYTWPQLLGFTVASCARLRTTADVPVLLQRQPWAMPWLIPGNCLREDAPAGSEQLVRSSVWA